MNITYFFIRTDGLESNKKYIRNNEIYNRVNAIGTFRFNYTNKVSLDDEIINSLNFLLIK